MARPRRLIIDAYNVLHVTGVLDPERAGPDLTDLARLIAGSRWGRLATSLVCDGPAPALPDFPPRVRAVFAGPGRDADSLIERMLVQDTAPRSIRVISSDRRIQRAAHRRRAGWMGSDEFLRTLNDDAGRTSRAPAGNARKPEPPLTGDAVADWLKRFGVADGHPLGRLRAASGRDRSIHPAADPKDGAQRSPGPGRRDPILDQAVDEWRGLLDPDDLDMRRWTPDATPLRDPDSDEPPSSSSSS